MSAEDVSRDAAPNLVSASRIDARRIAPVAAFAAILIGFAVCADPLAHAIYDTIEREPEALGRLRGAADPNTVTDIERSAVIVLVDGMRVDEAPAVAAHLLDGAAWTEIDVPLPTLSQPFYHAFLTGVPPAGTGIRRNIGPRPALVDSLADRTRASRGEVAWIAEGLDWMPGMFAEEEDFVDSTHESIGAPLDALLARIARGEGPALTVIHLQEVDESAHRSGTESAEHEHALELARATVERISRATRESILVVLSDHGHIANGGHGGDEPDVTRSPFVMRAPGLAPRRVERPIEVAEIAPTIAAWMGVAPPSVAVASAHPDLAPPSYRPSESARERAEFLAHATEREVERGTATRIAWLVVLAFGIAVTLAALAPLLRGFDRGTWMAPSIALAIVVVVHRVIWNRPFTMSAIDDIDRHGPHLIALGAGAALAGIAVAVVAGDRSAPWTLRVRRAAAAAGWAALAFAAFSIAFPGGALGPWPLGALAYYLPVLCVVAGAGASVAAALGLLVSLVPIRPRG
jgi:hypothetical protein